MQHDQVKHLHKHYIYWQAETCIIYSKSNNHCPSVCVSFDI